MYIYIYRNFFHTKSENAIAGFEISSFINPYSFKILDEFASMLLRSICKHRLRNLVWRYCRKSRAYNEYDSFVFTNSRTTNDWFPVDSITKSKNNNGMNKNIF